MVKHSAKRSWQSVLIVGGIVAFPSLAYANMGVPMLFLTLPMMAIGLVPIVVVEAWVLFYLLKIHFKRALFVSVIANLFSTFIGIPVTWALLVLAQMVTGGGSGYGIDTLLGKFLAVTWQAPWLLPYEGELYWMVPVATIVLLVPFFAASYWTEQFIARKVLRDLSAPLIREGIKTANLLTYTLILVGALMWLGANIFNESMRYYQRM